MIRGTNFPHVVVPENLWIVATVVFVPKGGRAHPAADSRRYCPHVVVDEVSPEYLGTMFDGDGKLLEFGVEHQIRFIALYNPMVDYAALQPGASFRIVEGGTTVGHGVVVRRDQ